MNKYLRTSERLLAPVRELKRFSHNFRLFKAVRSPKLRQFRLPLATVYPMADAKFSEFQGRKLVLDEQLVDEPELETWIARDSEAKYVVTVLSEPITDPSRQQIFIDTLSRMSNLRSQTLLPILGFTLCDPFSNLPTITYEFCSDQTLEELLNPNDQLTNTQKLVILSGIVAAAELFEGNGLDIGPLSADAVFLDSANEPKLVNCGLARLIDEDCDDSVIGSFGALILQVMATKIKDESSDDEDSSDSERIPIMPEFFVDLYSQCDEDSEAYLSFGDILRLFMSEEFIIPGADARAVHAYQIKVVSREFSKKMVIEIYQQSEIRRAQCDEMQSVVDYLTEELDSVKSDAEEFANKDRNIEKMKEERDKLMREMSDISYLMKCFTKEGCKVNIPVSAERIGIFGYLVASQKPSRDKFVVASQSSGDLYRIIDEHTTDNFSTGCDECEWVQFEFPKPISICSFKIRSAHKSFMKNWTITAISESGKQRTLFTATDEQGLNGPGKEMIVDVTATSSKVFRIQKTGLNWEGTNFARIKHVEMYSEEPEYCGGVFKTLLSRCGGDPHKAAVLITASNFDFSHFHKLSPSHSLCTLYDLDKPWIQFELTRGRVAIQGYRMQQYKDFMFSRWSLLGSNDGTNWKVIDKRNERVAKSPLRIINCTCDIPYRIFRIVSDMPNDDHCLKMRIRHFDIFGIYLDVGDVPFQLKT